MKLDESQTQALSQITEWLDERLRNPAAENVFRLGGAAGTGKTTLIKEVVQWCSDHGHTSELVTLSGKAASVLRSKGVDAGTIHSFYYTPNKKVIDQVAELEEERRTNPDPEIFRKLAHLKPQQFTPRDPDDVPDLIIVDEASMVDGKIAADLLESGAPILAVGDPSQLPPVESWGEPLFANQQPDALLRIPHRFGESGLVSDAAEATRANQPVPYAIIRDPWEVDLGAYDVILVARNETRWELIEELRTSQGRPSDAPVVGDCIVVWRNNKDEGLFNGEPLTVTELKGHPTRPSMLSCKAVNALGDSFSFDMSRNGFKGDAQLRKAVRNSKPDHIVASFGVVLTVHKAQGSQYQSVLVAEDQTWGKQAQAWRYTAVTRASEVLHVVGGTWLRPVRVR